MTQTQQFDGTEHITMYNEPERTSIAAILGLVCSCIGCCFGLTAIPGIFLSIFGIVGISRSRGRIGGMGFAIAGLLIGLLMTAIWIAAYGTASFGLGWVEKNAAAPTVQILSDIEAGDFDAARSAMGAPANSVTDDQMIVFREGYIQALGPVVGTTSGPLELFSGYGEVGQLIQNYNGRQNLIPVPIEFGSGYGLVVIEMDPNLMASANSSTVIPVRIYVVGSDGTEYVIPPNGGSGSGAGTTPELPGTVIEDFSNEIEDAADEVIEGDIPDGP